MNELKKDERGKLDITQKDTVDFREPPMYKILMWNDSTTPMDFVVNVLQQIYGKDIKQAVELMLYIHNNGSAVCGIYIKEIAETKILQTQHMASTYKFPLTVTMEENIK